MTRLLSLCVATLLAGCVGPGQVASLERERPPGESEIAQRQALLAETRQMAPAPFEKFDVAVVGGTCAPKVGAKFAVTACVNEQPCNGFGTRLAGGRLACACFEVAGGCGDGSFCNLRSRECVKLPADQYHTR